MLIIFKNRLFKTDVNCSNLKVVNTLSVVNGFYGSWTDNTTQYFQGYGTLQTSSSPHVSEAIYLELTDPACAQIHVDINNKSLKMADSRIYGSLLSGMPIIFRRITYGTSSMENIELFRLSGTSITGSKCTLNPCLVADIFITPGYIKYSFLSYNQVDSITKYYMNTTTSYIKFEQIADPDQLLFEGVQLEINQPYITNTRDRTTDWQVPWQYSGYVKTFYGSATFYGSE